MFTQAQQRSVLGHPWRIAALGAIVANVLFNYISSRGNSVGKISDDYPSLFTPAGYAFAIWGLIYAASLLYSVMALLPNQLEVRMHDRVAPWLLAVNVLSSVWILAFTNESFGASVLIILAMLAVAIVMYVRAAAHVKSEEMSLWWRVPFGLWLGWLSVATIANIGIALLAAGWDGSPLSQPVWASLMLCVAAGLALAVNILYKDPVVPLVVTWAATAIAVARWEDSTLVAVIASLIALKSLIWAVITLVLRHVPPAPVYKKELGGL